MSARDYWKRLFASKWNGNTEITPNAASEKSGTILANEMWRRTVSGVLTDNAVSATNAVETVIYHAYRPGQVLAAHIASGPAIPADATNYTVITLAKRTAGGTATTIATYNTHSSAQGAIAAANTHAMALSANSVVVQIAAGDDLTLKALKFGAGQQLQGAAGNTGTGCHADVEEI